MTALMEEASHEATPGPEPGTVSAQSTVGDALTIMDRTGAVVLVVVHEGDPVGIVTRADLEGTPARRPRASARVDDIMTLELVVVDPGDDVLETLNRYTDRAWDSLRRRGPCGEDEMRRRSTAFVTGADRL